MQTILEFLLVCPHRLRESTWPFACVEAIDPCAGTFHRRAGNTRKGRSTEENRMKKLAVAALPLLIATACAMTDAPRTTVAQAPAKGVSYCWKDRLNTNGDDMT